VPKDLKLSGNEETFTATVSYDTKDLFGKFDATCEIKLKMPEEKKDDDKEKKDNEEKKEMGTLQLSP
jgi:hypothetical protein